MALRLPTLAALVMLTVVTAGCNMEDWWDGVGEVRVELKVVGPDGSDIESLRSARIAIHSVQLRQLNSLEPDEFAFEQPLIVDFADLAKSGGRQPLVTQKFGMRAFESVTLRIEPLEAEDASGERMKGCFAGVRAEPPCLRVAPGGNYQLHTSRGTLPSVAAPRGGVATIVFPLAVHYDANTTEYFVAAKVAEIEREE